MQTSDIFGFIPYIFCITDHHGFCSMNCEPFVAIFPRSDMGWNVAAEIFDCAKKPETGAPCADVHHPQHFVAVQLNPAAWEDPISGQWKNVACARTSDRNCAGHCNYYNQ